MSLGNVMFTEQLAADRAVGFAQQACWLVGQLMQNTTSGGLG
jgi:hypothetical protein